MKKILTDIQDGTFAKDFLLDTDLISLFGVKWSGTKTTLSLSNTLSAICLKIGKAIGPVISFAITTSMELSQKISY